MTHMQTSWGRGDQEAAIILMGPQAQEFQQPQGVAATRADPCLGPLEGRGPSDTWTSAH